MTDEYSGFANHLAGRYDVSPKVIWHALTPGSHTYDWIKQDKSQIPTSMKVLISIASPIADTMKLAFYSGAAYGLARVVIDLGPVVKGTLEKLL